MADLPQSAELADVKRREALELLEDRWARGSEGERRARALLPNLRDLRLFELLARLGDRVARLDPKDALVRRMQTQALIETGHPTAAVEVARAALRGLPESDREWSELHGLIGRAYKQILMEARDPGDRQSQEALRVALAAYGKPFRQNPGNDWHAINLIAILSFARRRMWKVPGQPDPRNLAGQVISSLEKKVREQEPNEYTKWSFATLAEAYLAIDDLDSVERSLHLYLTDPYLKSFDVASTLRQFSQLWSFKDTADPRRQGILQSLHARLLSLPGAQISYSSEELTDLANGHATNSQLQAILGAEGTRSYNWWKKGLLRAASVGAVYSDGDKRIGTCFLVPGEDLIGAPAAGSYVLTNAHVVSESGSGGDLRPEDATVVFEALDVQKHYRLDPAIVRFSPVDRHDACLLRLEEKPPDVAPLPIARNLPLVKKLTPEEAVRPDAEQAKMRVYVIGYPAGGGLEFSFQDNELLDHEGKTEAAPCRVHYRAPTEKGSSGSPVFNRGDWEVIALHHKGGELSRLNGQAGSYLANEGISILSILAAFQSS